MTEPVRCRVDVDGVSAGCLTAGDGPIVLLVHGTYWSRVWWPAIGHLAAAGWRAVAVDLPGCGRSAASSLRAERRAGRHGMLGP